MACTNCTQTTASITGFVPATCQDTSGCFLDAGCVYYTGPALSCTGIEPNDALDTILQKIDPLICGATGDYSTYNTYCLAPINNVQEFVESISNFVCTLRDDFDTFVDTTYAGDQSVIDGRLDALEVPAITCATAGVVNTDSLSQVLTKYCTKFGEIDSALDISGADWSQCYVVSPAPTTPTEGFDVLIDQICLLKEAVEDNTASLPTFNNTGSCLPTPVTSSDSLVDTVNKIKTRLCQTGTLDTTELTWGCVTQPTGGQNLQDTLQNILSKVTEISQNLPMSWSADFDITNVDDEDLCLGKEIALNEISFSDRLVAATDSDLSPGVLEDKLTAGTGITLDFITTPGEVIINSTATGTDDHKVATDDADDSPDYLSLKIGTGATSSGVQAIPVLDAVDHIVRINMSVDVETLIQSIIDALSDDPDLFAQFCVLMAGCPSPCDAPSNIQVTYSSGSTTTTTTTTNPD